MVDQWVDDGIRYWDLEPMIFTRSGVQSIIPFLGAGASVSDRKSNDPALAPAYPPPETVQQICNLLQVDGNAKIYLEYAIRTALQMQAWEKSNGLPPSREEFGDRLAKEVYPPFAWELAEMISLQSTYHSLTEKAIKAIDSKELLPREERDKFKALLLPMLKMMSLTTGLGNATDPLTSISSYYESTSQRKLLWQVLYDAIGKKDTPTGLHRLLADAAHEQVSAGTMDYLIITTNYDWLMEKALEDHDPPVPHVVLRPDRADGQIHVRFGGMPEKDVERLTTLYGKPKAPKDSAMQYKETLAVVYKMHGCLYKKLTPADDGLVVTDADYVDFITRMDDIIPSHVGQLLGGKPFLFLGYSFSDWNVRSLFEKTITRGGRNERDYAVTRSLSTFEEVYFKEKNLVVVKAPLADFVTGIEVERKKVKEKQAEEKPKEKPNEEATPVREMDMRGTPS